MHEAITSAVALDGSDADVVLAVFIVNVHRHELVRRSTIANQRTNFNGQIGVAVCSVGDAIPFYLEIVAGVLVLQIQGNVKSAVRQTGMNIRYKVENMAVTAAAVAIWNLNHCKRMAVRVIYIGYAKFQLLVVGSQWTDGHWQVSIAEIAINIAISVNLKAIAARVFILEINGDEELAIAVAVRNLSGQIVNMAITTAATIHWAKDVNTFAGFIFNVPNHDFIYNTGCERADGIKRFAVGKRAKPLGSCTDFKTLAASIFMVKFHIEHEMPVFARVCFRKNVPNMAAVWWGAIRSSDGLVGAAVRHIVDADVDGWCCKAVVVEIGDGNGKAGKWVSPNCLPLKNDIEKVVAGVDVVEIDGDWVVAVVVAIARHHAQIVDVASTDGDTVRRSKFVNGAAVWRIVEANLDDLARLAVVVEMRQRDWQIGQSEIAQILPFVNHMEISIYWVGVVEIQRQRVSSIRVAVTRSSYKIGHRASATSA